MQIFFSPSLVCIYFFLKLLHIILPNAPYHELQWRVVRAHCHLFRLMKYPDFENGLILFHIFVFFYLCLSSIKLINNSPIHTVHLTLVDSNVCKKSLNAETKPPSPDILQLFITFHYFTIEKKQNFDYNV